MGRRSSHYCRCQYALVSTNWNICCCYLHVTTFAFNAAVARLFMRPAWHVGCTRIANLKRSRRHKGEVMYSPAKCKFCSLFPSFTQTRLPHPLRDAQSGFFDLFRVCTDQLATHIFVKLANQISQTRLPIRLHDRVDHSQSLFLRHRERDCFWIYVGSGPTDFNHYISWRPRLWIRVFKSSPHREPPFYASEKTHSFYTRIEALHQTRYSPTCMCLRS
jgi:hypothetical protein